MTGLKQFLGFGPIVLGIGQRPTGILLLRLLFAENIFENGG
jgi:hypothetical protein